MTASAFSTRSVDMVPMYLVSFLAPAEDVDRIMNAILGIDPLAAGKYDCNAYVTAPGTERYRPREGAAAGAEDVVRQRPGVVEVSFQLPADRQKLDEAIEAIFQVHSYQESTITVAEVLASRSKGLDDSKNPNRWWNTTGDWKKKREQA